MENTQPTAEKEPKGKIVTFYSYKGGVGRSMALANIAVLLAKMGKKVLIVDFDLEAPGLDRFFAGQTVAPPANRGGLINLLLDMQSKGFGSQEMRLSRDDNHTIHVSEHSGSIRVRNDTQKCEFSGQAEPSIQRFESFVPETIAPNFIVAPRSLTDGGYLLSEKPTIKPIEMPEVSPNAPNFSVGHSIGISVTNLFEAQTSTQSNDSPALTPFEFETGIEFADGSFITLIHSGNDAPQYDNCVNQFSWRSFFSNAHGAKQLEVLRNDWRSRFDFILIDSRTGITDIGGVCSVQLPDYLVLVFAANDQNLDGCKRVVEGIHKQRAAFAYDRERLQIIPLLSRFEGRAEKELSNLWLEKAAKVMQPMLDDWLPKQIPALEYFDKTKLPHIPKYAFGEQLACLEERETDPDSLTYYYSAIARLIAGHLQKPERLLALTRRLSQSEVDNIFKRASDLEQNRDTLAQMEKLIATFTGPAASQAEPLRGQIKKLSIHDPDLREDLEATAIHAEGEWHRDTALTHLKNLPDWTNEDSERLSREIERHRNPRANPAQAVDEELDPDLALLLRRLQLSTDVTVRRDAIDKLCQDWLCNRYAKAAFLQVIIGIPEAGVSPDIDPEVRTSAVYALSAGWNDNADSKAALLRVIIGVPGTDILPDKDNEVRIQAIAALRDGWAGDSDSRNAFLGLLIAVFDTGARHHDESSLRLSAAYALRENWNGDPMVRERLRVMIQILSKQLGPDHEKTTELCEYLDFLTPEQPEGKKQ